MYDLSLTYCLIISAIAFICRGKGIHRVSNAHGSRVLSVPLMRSPGRVDLRPGLKHRSKEYSLLLLCFQVTSTNVDIARVAPKYHLYTTAEVEEVMSRL